MKFGDFVLNKKLMEEAEENLKNLSGEQMKEMRLMTAGSAFIAGMMVELLESDTFVNLEMEEKKASDLLLKMFATGAALGILNVASRSNAPDLCINIFKHYFESVTQQFLGIKK